MTRGISAATLAALEDNVANPIYFVELRIDVDSSPQVIDRLHTQLGTIAWGGFNWTGAGDFASIDTIKETNSINPSAIRMGLSGIDSAITDLVFTANYYMRPCLVYMGAIVNGALVENPSLVFSGFIQSIDMVIAGDDGDTVVLTAESELIMFQRSRNVRYTNMQLQSEYAGDLGCEFLESVATQSVVWRGKNNNLGTSRSGPSGGGSSGPGGTRPDR